MHSVIEQFSPSGAFAEPAGRALLACLVSFALTMIFAPRVIRALISLKIGQPIRTAEEVHKLAELHGAKAGTPTMGGVLIVGSMTAATLLCARMGNPFIIACLIVTLALGLLGFRDDYLKVAKKTSDGISARKKLLVQFLAGLAGVTFLYLYPEGSPRVELHDYISSLFIPFYGQVNLPWFVYIPFGVVVVMSASNAVNLTDGLDGLAFGRQRLNSGSSLGISLGSLVEVVGKHFVSHALSPSSCLSAEYPQGQLAQTVVHAGDQCHQQQHEDKHGEGPEEQFLAGRSDDLAEFVDNLFDEQANAHEDVRLNGLLAVLRLRHNNPPLSLL